jgi:diguanylate cyclase (GGDEF)-like protein
MRKNKKFSRASKGLNYKLKIAFSLMTILPLLVSTYLISNYVFPKVGFKPDIVVTLFLSVVIAVIGLLIIKEVFDRINHIIRGAKIIASGDLFLDLKEKQDDDEIGDLGVALNTLTERIRSNMNEIKEYSLKTTEINLAIQKRVLVLSNLLHISSLISEGTRLKDVFQTVVEKTRFLANSGSSFIFYREENQETFYLCCIDGQEQAQFVDIKIEPTDDIFYKVNGAKKPIILDKGNLLTPGFAGFFRDKIKVNNTVILPVKLRGRVILLLGLGNNQESYLYSKEDIELLEIFAKQLAIAAEKDILSRNVAKLETKDSLTGLYNDVFIRSRLQEEIKRSIAYQRPCALIMMDIDNFKTYSQKFGSLQTEAVVKNIAILIKESVGEIEQVGRMGDDEFAIILPEKNKRQARAIAEVIRNKVMAAYGQTEDLSKKVTISAGVSENPIDGITSDELLAKAEEFLLIAKSQGRNRIIVSKEF